MAKNRPDKVEFEKRLLTIQSWMVDSVPTSIIIQQILFKEWVKSERHAFMLVQKARERWIKFEDDSREDKRKMKVQELKTRIRNLRIDFKNTPAGLRTILMYEKEIIRLEGLYFVAVKSTTINADDDYISPLPVVSEKQSNINYSLLSDDVLRAIASARIQPND